MSDTGNSISEVSDIKIISPADFDALVDRFATIAWPVAAGDVDRLLTTWGWGVEERVGDRGIVVDPGLGFDALDPGWVHLEDADGSQVSDIVVAIADESDDRDAATARDAFADQVASVVARFGDPAGRKGGDKPSAFWVLPSDSRLVLYGSRVGALLEVTSPTHGRLLRDTD